MSDKSNQIKQELNTIAELEKLNGKQAYFMYGSEQEGFVNLGPILSASLRGVMYAYCHQYKDNLETELKKLK